jgi:DNA polymerase I-like protein with 3'-5' exonuclease and polymerase domains
VHKGANVIIKNYADFQKVLSWLDKQTTVAYDLETTGLKPRIDQVIGIALGNETEAFYIVHQHFDHTNKEFFQFINKTTLAPLFQKLLTKKLITFNGSFDIRFTRHYFKVDLSPSLWSEAQLARHTADENLSPWDGLKKISSDLFGSEAGQEQRDLNESIILNGGKPGEVYLGDLDIVGKYAEQDAILTCKVNSHFLKSVEIQGLSEFYFETEVMPLYKNVTIDMEDTGVKLDMPRLQAAHVEITTDIKMLESKIRGLIAPYLPNFDAWYLAKTVVPKRSGAFAQAVGEYLNVELPRTKTGNFSMAKGALEKLPDCLFKRFIEGTERLPDDIVLAVQKQIQGNDNSFNLQSKDHWKFLFFQILNEEPISRTDKKQDPQLDDDFLESVKSKYDFVPALLDFNKLNKIKSTYIERFIEKAENGRFYPRYMQHATVTARYGSDLQQLPRPKEESELSELPMKYTNMIRSFFIADDGRLLVGADYASLEIVVFADDAGDEPLLDIIRSKLDPYSKGAIDALGLSEYSADKKALNFLKIHRPDIRQAAKPWFLGLRYGMESYKLSKTLEIPEYEAKSIIKGYFSAYPKLKVRMEQLKAEAKKNGFVKSKAGRIRHLKDIQKLHAAWGDVFENSLRLWEKYGENKTKYEQMKFLKTKYLNDLRGALNFPIQSMAASIVNAASIAIQKEFKLKGLDACIIMNVHDEIVVSCAEQQVEEVKRIMQDKMENTTKLSVPLTAEPKIGRNYAEVK